MVSRKDHHDGFLMTKTTRTLLVLVSIGWIGLIPIVRTTVYRGLYLLAMGHLAQFHQFLISLGPWAPVVSTVLMVSQSIAIPIPVTLLMVANGLAFGVWHGMLISFAGGFVGALAAYQLGRRLGRAVVERFVSYQALDVADRLMARRGGWAVVIGRWVPGIPCDPLSYAAGIMRMPRWTFVWLTILGLIPANLVTAYVGAEATGDVRTSYWIGGLLVIAALWICWKFAQRQRKRRMMD
jgi:uncharacterized membrane protein YdjX (TVP38/TMEM64 family)